MSAIESGDIFKSTSSAAAGSVTLTKAGVANSFHYLTDLSASSDMGTATLTVKDNTTVIWRERIGNTTPYSHSFSAPLKSSVGTAFIVTLDCIGTAYVNIAGFTLGY